MLALLDRLSGGDADESCRCEATFDADRLVVDAGDCPGGGDLATAAACRRTVVTRLRERDVSAVLTRAAGHERVYDGDAAALLVAAGRFADAVAVHDEDLGERACRDPLAAARAATGRPGPVGRVVATSGLAEVATGQEGYADALRPYVGPQVSRARVVTRPPADARLVERRELETGATVRLYDRPATERRTYHLDPVEADLGREATATLAAAYDRLAGGAVRGGDRAPGRAVRRVAGDDTNVERLAAVLGKHTAGFGVLADLFADERVSDVFLTAPADDAPVSVRVDGDHLRTNVKLSERGVAALSSRFRRESGRAFSRATPTLDATVTVAGRRVRVAGVTDPVSDGPAFAFRAHESDAWTLPALVENGTLTPEAAALLSVAVERDAATLLAGTRGAGKTTLLGALLWELPATTRVVVIEDTPELPVAQLRAADRDVQALRTDEEGVGPTAALRTALRLGEGALVLGEVRGEEAGVLYEAMRVGASGSAVLGTIHGDGGPAVCERVVTDLGVPASSFAATDLVVTCEPCASQTGRARRVRAVEEVLDGEDGPRFEPLFAVGGEGLHATGRIARGNSRLVGSLARPTETYAAVRGRLEERAAWFRETVEAGRTAPEAVVEAHARRRSRDGCT